MGNRDKNQVLKAARSLESSGQLKSAAQLYMSVGAVQEAARILANAGRHDDAGRLLLGSLKVGETQVGRLDSARRKLAYLAATYFAKGKEKETAVQIFVSLGEKSRAADVLERTGDFLGAQRIREGQAVRDEAAHPTVGQTRAVGGTAVNRRSAERLEQEGKLDLAIGAYVQLKQYGEAGRILQMQGRTAEAANMYAQGGMPYEAARCYLEVGDTGKGLDNLIRVPRSEKQSYRAAANQAVRLAAELNVLSFQFEHFLTEFVASGPTEEREFETFYILSQLYERQDLLENAKEALNKIITFNPNYRDVAAKLQALTAQTQGSSGVYERIRVQEASFRGERRIGSAPLPKPKAAPGLPPLPEIPDLPPAPNLGSVSAAGGPDQAQPVAGLQDLKAVAHEATQAGLPIGIDQQAAAPVVPPVGPVSPPVEQQEVGFVVGNTIADRYLLEAKIGEGGMAMVFRAKDLELDEKIALKVFLQQVLDKKTQSESQARFKQELKLSRKLLHKNIIRLYDIGFFHGHRYISMELLTGSPLEDILESKIDFARGLAYLTQVCAGLHAAHETGVIHRDIKPDNLFVTEEEIVKVMDFGIAKNTHAQGMTMEGMTAGTPEYMAPEQISSFTDVTASADMYSLGLIAYRMFTGTLPFEHEELMPLLMMHLQQAPRPPRELNPDISEELEKIILRLLEKNPQDRFASCHELASHLQKVRAGHRRS